MKPLLLLTALIISSSFGYTQKDTINVLFLGNSYTGVNNLPKMVHDVASSAGTVINYDSNTPGGYTLQLHSTNATSIQKIKAGDLDFVVLQEQSQLPSFPTNQVQTDVYPYAVALNSMINSNNPCAETVFYMTWGRKNGDSGNCPNWPPVCTYDGMDSLLNLRYTTMANANSAILSPVGALWHYLRDNRPDIELYSADESHPSLAGSYAAACSFFSVLTRKDPTLITDDLGLPPHEAEIIRTVAKAVIYDDFVKWNVGSFNPISKLIADTAGNHIVSFTNTSNYSNEFLWDFGDGNTSTDENPNHTYSVPGLFTITLIASNCGNYPDTISINHAVHFSASIHGINYQSNIAIYPNPFSANVYIDVNELVNLKILNATGKFILEIKQFNGGEIDFNDFRKGVYLCLLTNEKGLKYSKKVVKY